MNTEFAVKLHNRFDAVVIDTKTNEIKQTAKAENTVLNGYWSEPFANASYIGLALGTGTGTPSITDTNLFRFLGMRNISRFYDTRTISRVGPHEWKKVWVTTFPENQAIGNLTEIGLGRAADNAEWGSTNLAKYYTHAVFTDAEGNPITITKKDTDRLTITITVFLTLAWSTEGPIYPRINIRNPKTACDPRLDYMPNDTYSEAMIHLWLLHETLINSSVALYTNTLPIRYMKTAVNLDQSATFTFDSANLKFKNQAANRILSTAGNLADYSTYIIRCIYNEYAFAPLPNSSIYPSRLLTLTAIGDGTTTNFNFDVPILNTNNVKVYINDVLQDSNTYSFNGKNFKHPQGWNSCDTLYVSKIDWYPWGSSGGFDIYYTLSPIIYYFESTATTNLESTATYYYDFKTPYTVSALGKCTPTAFDRIRGVPRLYYSTDNENWIPVNIPEWSTTSAYTNYGNINTAVISITPIIARYWKVEQPIISLYGNRTTNCMYASILFDDPKPQLQFNTAPPAESTIRVEAYCDYPIKNSNWIVENSIAFDYTFTRQ